MGIRHLNAHPDCAFVSGHYSVIRSNGQIMPQSRHSFVVKDYYVELLRGNYIGMHGTVMYRRAIFEDAWAVSMLLWELVKITTCIFELRERVRSLATTRSLRNIGIIGKYVQKSRADAEVVPASLRHSASICGDPKQTEAFEDGIRFWQTLYGDRLIRELRGSTRHAIRNMPVLLRYYPRGFARLATGPDVDLPRHFSDVRRNLAVQIYLHRWRGFKNGRPPVGGVRFGDLRRCYSHQSAISVSIAGCPSTGTTSSDFCRSTEDNIHGRVLEIGDDTYTRQFGDGRVIKADVFDVSADNSKGDFRGRFDLCGLIYRPILSIA